MLTANDVIFSPLGGGFLQMVSPDGEIIADIAIPEGHHPSRSYLQYQVDGIVLRPKGVEVITRGAKAKIVAHHCCHETAVKTGYQPSAAHREAQFFARVLRATEAKAARMVAEATAKITQQERRDAVLTAEKEAAREAALLKGEVVADAADELVEPVVEVAKTNAKLSK